uniref:Scavenger receptor class B member 1 n=1 Tax=Megaselia scalaris TaxID=36166 RepID=T1H2B7_MEGSC
MDHFGYLSKLNGLDYIPAWEGTACANINGSEGSFFPPREITKSNRVNVYDKDLCRVIPLVYQRSLEKDGIVVDLFELDDLAYGNSIAIKENECFDDESFSPKRGIQNISPCHYGAPVYLSNPHFYQTDDIYLNAVEGLVPNESNHKTYFKIQPKIGVPLEGKVRIQLNLKVTNAPYISAVKNFRDFMFPIMWMEEGISELTPEIKRWIYLATVIAPNLIPLLSYIFILVGAIEVSIGIYRAYSGLYPINGNYNEMQQIESQNLQRNFTFHNQGRRRYSLLLPNIDMTNHFRR